MDFIKEEKKFMGNEEKDIKEIWKRIKKRDFEGNKGLTIKNSIFLFLTNFFGKIGSLFFTIILARILMPELFGLYSLALATILIFAGFSDMGAGTAIIKFVSASLGKKKKQKAKAYFIHFLKIKSFLVISSSLALLIFAKFIAQNYYNKPIYLSLLAGALYIISINLLSLYDTIAQAYNNFKFGMFKEIFTQTLRLVVVPLAVLLFIDSFSASSVLFVLFISLVLAYLISFCLLYFILIKKEHFFKGPKKNLTKKEKRTARNFLILVSSTILSGLFLGYIDIIMLGRFVEGNILGFYQAAFSLIGGLIPLIPFASVLLPIFSRMKGKSLEKGFDKSKKLVFIISFLLCVLTIVFAPLIIKIVYGKEYLSSITLLRILSILVILLPLSSLYEAYFISKGKPGIVAKYLVISTILNIILNYILIRWLLNYSPLMASFGAAIATILSRAFYFMVLLIKKSSQRKIV